MLFVDVVDLLVETFYDFISSSINESYFSELIVEGISSSEDNTYLISKLLNIMKIIVEIIYMKFIYY